MNGKAAEGPKLFDTFVESYELACHQGLKLAGETRDYFAQQRVIYTGACCRDMPDCSDIMDFGCGPGYSCVHLLNAFPRAKVLGIDNSAAMIEAARAEFQCDRADFLCGGPESAQHEVDLIYCNGVFHHIPPPDRSTMVRSLHSRLRPGGRIAFWENNPWNPGTRLVMSRIPFDRDAITLTYRESQNLLKSARFEIMDTTFHFYFPSSLKVFRRLEPMLRHFPLGGQYCVVARKA